MKNSLYWLGVLACLLTSCGSGNESKSSTTGWTYNTAKNGGFQKIKGADQKTGPGLVYVEGGTFVMGSPEQDLGYSNDTRRRRVTVASFYIDRTEVRNLDWLEYLYWTQRVYPDSTQMYKDALPDTLVWRRYSLNYNDPFVENYLRHPAYQEYPVVGISWVQATEYAAWRTDRVNERILIEKGIQKENPEQSGGNTFNTDAYLAGQYEGVVGKNVPNLAPNAESKTRPVRSTDGILQPAYRLPTEAEWEYAALGLNGNVKFENIQEKKVYPWNGLTLRSVNGKTKGLMLANFKRGRGDYSGVAGYKNDASEITAPVVSFMPNDWGLYNMAGNVNEWVLDVYRPLSAEDVEDFNPYRGNVYKRKLTDSSGTLLEKDGVGRLRDTIDNKNFERPDLRGDGDDAEFYGYGVTSLINDHSRVYKGGSWSDLAYWMQPGTRRFIDQDSSTADIGFRCAMVRVGGSAIQDGKPSFSKKPVKNNKWVGR